MTAEFKHQLGSYARDLVTGGKGVLTGRIEYLTGCRQYILQPKADKDGVVGDSRWVDEDRLLILEDGHVTIETQNNGPDTPPSKKF